MTRCLTSIEHITDDETRAYFGRVVGDREAAWWVAQIGGEIVGYMLIDGADLDHLYVRPSWQRRGIGLSLLTKAKALSPLRLELWTFQRNANARAFYEAHGFRAIAYTDGRNCGERAGRKIRVGPATT